MNTLISVILSRVVKLCCSFFFLSLKRYKTVLPSVTKWPLKFVWRNSLTISGVCHIATDILPPALRLLFKQEWDNLYKATFGEWKDTPQNGLDFKNGESPAKERKNARLLER